MDPIIVQINDWSGGIAEDQKELKTNSFAISNHFDTFSKGMLIPYRIMETETIDTGTIGDYKITDVIQHTDATRQNIFALGKSGGGNEYPKFFQKTGAFGISDNFQSLGTDSGNIVIPGTLQSYYTTKKLYALKTDNTSTLVISCDNGGTIAAVGTISNVVAGNVRPFRHPLDDILYFGAGNVIASLNNTSFTASAITAPSDRVITSLCDLNSYLAVATKPINAGQQSRVYLWGRNTALTTFQEQIDFGEDELQILENINGALVGISKTNATFGIYPKVSIRVYTGGVPRIVKEFVSDSATSFNLYQFKQKVNNRLFFAMAITIQGVLQFQIFSVYQNEYGEWVCTGDRLINNDTAITSLQGFSIIGDYLWAGVNNNGTILRTRYASATYTTTSIVETLINQNMAKEHRPRLKVPTFTAVSVESSGQVIVKYRPKGSDSYVTVGTMTFTEAGRQMADCQVADGEPMLEGRDLQFRIESTNGAIISGFEYAYELREEPI